MSFTMYGIFKLHDDLREYRKRIGRKPDLPCYIFTGQVTNLGKTPDQLSGNIHKAILVFHLKEPNTNPPRAIVRRGLIMGHKGRFLMPMDSFKHYFKCKTTF